MAEALRRAIRETLGVKGSALHVQCDTTYLDTHAEKIPQVPAIWDVVHAGPIE